MKGKIWILSAALIVLMVGWAAAENETQQVGDFSSGLGAKVRLLQLESAIERNILAGQEVVSAVHAGNSSADTGDLEAILAEMTALKGEVASAAGNQSSGDDAARDFVDMKGDARDLSKEFRDKARELIKAEDLEGLRGRVRNITKDEGKDLRMKINETRMQYNAQKVQDALQALGIQDQGLVDRVLSGDAKLKDVMDAIKEATSNMSRQDRRKALLSLQEQFTKGNVFVRSVEDKVMFRQLDRAEERLQRRLDNAGKLNLSDAARGRLENRTAWIDARMEKIRGRVDARVERIGNLTDKRLENIDKLEGKLENRSERLSGNVQDRLEGGNLTDEQRLKFEERLGSIQNKTDERMGRLEGRKEKIQENGQKLMDKAGNLGGNGKGGGNNGG